MKKILYDKLNNRPSDIQWFTDQDGGYWIDTDPFGIQMSGKVTIIFLRKDHRQFEMRELKE